MIEGTVRERQRSLKAQIDIDIINNRGYPQCLRVTLDTGFTGHLALPLNLIQKLGLQHTGPRPLELANGEISDFEEYLAQVSWHGHLSDVYVLETNSAPLLGMALLKGSRVTADVLTGGKNYNYPVCYLNSTPEWSRLKAAILRFTRVQSRTLRVERQERLHPEPPEGSVTSPEC